MKATSEQDVSRHFRAQADFEKARIRIAAAIRNRSTKLDLTGLGKLASLPRELAEARYVRVLRLTSTSVADLSPLAGMSELSVLHLDNTKIEHLGALANLSQLSILSLNSTRISDLKPLAALTKLRDLRLVNCPVSDISVVAHFNELESLAITNTRVSDLSPLRDAQELRNLLIGSTSPDLRPLENLPQLRFLNLKNTGVADLSPLAGLTGLIDAVAGGELQARSGLIFEGCAGASPAWNSILATRGRGVATIEIINELRRRQGMAEYWPASQVCDVGPEAGLDVGVDLEQQAATYSFQYSHGKIVAVAQKSKPADQNLATEIYEDLRRKTSEAVRRLTSCNAAPRLGKSLDRLLATLGDSLQGLSAGRLLMCSRSLEADVSAHDTASARREISEDAFAHLLDVVASLADLKACYPAITRLEAARVAQDLLSKDVNKALEGMNALQTAAAVSPIVDASVLEALASGAAEIRHVDEILSNDEIDGATRSSAAEKRAETTAQMLLDHRNFVASVLRLAGAIADGASQIAHETGRQIVKKGPGPFSDIAVSAMAASLVGILLGPTTALAAFVATYKPLAKRAAQISQAAARLANARAGKVDASVSRRRRTSSTESSDDEVVCRSSSIGEVDA